MRIAIIQFPGSNCERETMLAVKRVGMEPIPFLWNEPKTQLHTMDGFIIVGGFSYEDRSRAGIIAALDPLMQEIKAQSETGKPILGICNGAQILVESGLVPGTENLKLALALTENKRVQENKILGTGYYNAWVHMRLAENYQRNAFTATLNKKKILRVPVAHAEGRFLMTQAVLQEIKMQGQHVFQYCDENGVIDEHFPINPNGSIENIAAISNKAGNVMAMMPHPERTKAGDVIFESMRNYIAKGCQSNMTTPLYYYPRTSKMPRYTKPNGTHEWMIELIITDNQALTVQNSLQQLGFPITVKRQVHWEITCNDEKTLAAIKKTGVLFNERKEREVQPASHSFSSLSLLTRAKEDWLGEQKRQILQDHFSIQGVSHIQHGILWHLESKTVNINALLDDVLKTHILYNHYAHDCYEYRYEYRKI